MRPQRKLPLITALMGLAHISGAFAGATTTTRKRKPHPTMVTSSPAEIAEHNEGVKTRQVMRSVYKPWKGAVQKANWMAARLA